MKLADVKVSFYDIISYLFTGLLFLLLLFLFHYHIAYQFSLISLPSLNFNTSIILILLLLCYILGHLLSTISSAIFEKFLYKRKIEQELAITELLSKELYNSFLEKYNRLFNCIYNEKNFRTVICYVESFQPNIYNTSFSFLSIYGMCRNMSLLFLVFSIGELYLLAINKNLFLLIFILLYLFLSFVFQLAYFRFMKYFKEEIISGFLVPNTI